MGRQPRSMPERYETHGAAWTALETYLLRQPHDSNNEVGHRILCQNSAVPSIYSSAGASAVKCWWPPRNLFVC